MSRVDEFWGAHDVQRMFPGDRPVVTSPFPAAGRRKTHADYDAGAVHAALKDRPELTQVDPRSLRTLQPQVTRAGVAHYMGSKEVYADHHQAGNAHPVVYQRDDGQNLLLSGNHRAAAALLKGEPLHAVTVKGGYGAPRKAFTPKGPSAR